MDLIDDIEFYGRAAAAGDMTREAAIQALVQVRQGRLTVAGAADMIDRWQTVRAKQQHALDTRPLAPEWATDWQSFVMTQIAALDGLNGRQQ
ncbi:hypothetical protein [Streptomyces sp. NEAU-S7GS2]|uniref:hypothetical protein n=1 Tax=Streptomyces sp. NEAU-S7GS2 TaxID=2202000 RepID=UPI000D6FB12F|nr:hypothetical protein [Streptomyces sp. NEAU-S7GS2]AWN24834.1 hypothetical protein DKG71_00355 [Streptomyces sp. NEAU-S7GS2]